MLFAYCPTDLLSREYRQQLVLEELLAYQVGIWGGSWGAAKG